jgi:predicted phosphodiesterase
VLPSTPPEAIGVLDADAVATGHVHQQWLRRFERTLWFCVGAVGISRWCEYALVDDETLAVEFHRIPFDVDELIAVARANDFPHFDRWVQSWTA